MNNSIHHSETICNSLKEKNIYKIFSTTVMRHIITILVSIFCMGYRGKAVNFANHSDNHRTTLAHFLNKGKWNDGLFFVIFRNWWFNPSIIFVVYIIFRISAGYA